MNELPPHASFIVNLMLPLKIAAPICESTNFQHNPVFRDTLNIPRYKKGKFKSNIPLALSLVNQAVRKFFFDFLPFGT
jgi:hypothetical protein